ncbi:MAG TPA: hypothetical protein ENJ95_02435 [Bacteroidetes bacterium]|nr:hypothetical protein [Bacteroidota bacterium]
MKNKLPKYLLGALYLLLLLPLVSQVFSLSENNLKGYSEKAEKPEWSIGNWLSGSFQSQGEKYLSQNFGARDVLVKLDNQYRFSFFEKSNVRDLVVGKNGYLFEEGYIKAYIGSEYIGDKSVKKKLQRLVAVEKKLKELGKELLIVAAAGKASFFPEYIPDHYFPRRETNNIDEHKKAFTDSGLNYIDFNEWFVQMKDTSRYPLFPKTGIHWTEYGMTLAADSLVHYLEKLEGIDLPDIKIKDIELLPKPHRTDNDIEKSMNLFFDIPTDGMIYAYPKIEYHSENKDSLKVLVVGDSYYWQMYSMKLSKNVFNNGQFLYYGGQIYPGAGRLENDDLMDFISSYDVIVMMCTEANLKSFPWGLQNSLYELLCKDEHDLFIQAHLEEILEQEDKIRADEKWFKEIKEAAKNAKMEVDEVLRKDAVFVVENRYL